MFGWGCQGDSGRAFAGAEAPFLVLGLLRGAEAPLFNGGALRGVMATLHGYKQNVGILRLRLLFALEAQRAILAQDDKSWAADKPGAAVPTLSQNLDSRGGCVYTTKTWTAEVAVPT